MKRRIGMFAVLLLVAAVPPAALAAKAKSHSVSATLRVVNLSTQGNPPLSGSSVTVGTGSGSLGTGAIVGNATYAAPNFASKFTLFLAKGTIKGSFTGTGSVNQDGSGSGTGSGKVLGGTGIYKGATGKFTFTAAVPASGPSTFQVKGKIKY
jgi:hypothetical protein